MYFFKHVFQKLTVVVTDKQQIGIVQMDVTVSVILNGLVTQNTNIVSMACPLFKLSFSVLSHLFWHKRKKVLLFRHVIKVQYFCELAFFYETTSKKKTLDARNTTGFSLSQSFFLCNTYFIFQFYSGGIILFVVCQQNEVRKCPCWSILNFCFMFER